MCEESRRIAVVVPAELANEIDALKKSDYWDRSMSELLRDLIRAGLDARKDKAA